MISNSLKWFKIIQKLVGKLESGNLYFREIEPFSFNFLCDTKSDVAASVDTCSASYLSELCTIWFAYFQLQSHRHSALRKLWKVIWKAANSHRRNMWICCGMNFKDLPRTLFMPPTDSLLSAEFQGMLKHRKMPSPPLNFRTLWGERTILKFLFKEKRGLYALPWGHIQLLFKINILNLKNADFSCISRVRQYSTLKDYYYFSTR